MKQAKELYNKIDLYPKDEWVDSPEFAELKETLENNDIETLKKNGYRIPNWKKPSKNLSKPKKKDL